VSPLYLSGRDRPACVLFYQDVQESLFYKFCDAGTLYSGLLDFLMSQSSSTCSQEVATGLFPKSGDLNLQPPNLVLRFKPPTLSSPSGHFHSGYPTKLRVFNELHACYMNHLSHPPWIGRVYVMGLFIMQFLEPPVISSL
jgi:hypothetical protein